MNPKKDFEDAWGLTVLADRLQLLSIEAGDLPADLFTRPDGLSMEDSEPFIDCRLRYFEGKWSLLTGDGQYDQDHRGWWASNTVVPNMTAKQCQTTAYDLYDEVMDSIAESNDPFYNLSSMENELENENEH